MSYSKSILKYASNHPLLTGIVIGFAITYAGIKASEKLNAYANQEWLHERCEDFSNPELEELLFDQKAHS